MKNTIQQPLKRKWTVQLIKVVSFSLLKWVKECNTVKPVLRGQSKILGRQNKDLYDKW